MVASLKEDQAAADQAWTQAKNSEESLTAAKEAQGKVREDMKVLKTLLKEFMDKYRELARSLKVAPVEDATSDNASDEEQLPA
jgi:hypothetical protein